MSLPRSQDRAARFFIPIERGWWTCGCLRRVAAVNGKAFALPVETQLEKNSGVSACHGSYQIFVSIWLALSGNLASEDIRWWICAVSDATGTRAAVASHRQLAAPTIAMHRYLHRAATANER
jgi:hypothetical protein